MNSTRLSEHPYNLEIAFSKKLVCRFGHPDSWRPNFALRNSNVKSELNSCFFRSDEFTSWHTGKHVLFAGCSYTWGEGSLYDETWAYKVAQKVGASGYYNIGTPAASIASQVMDIFKYVSLYGKPEVIFFNMPGMQRLYTSDNANTIYDGVFDPMTADICLINYQYYSMLEIFCKQNNIQLFSFAWDSKGVNDLAFADSDTYYAIDHDLMAKDIFILSTSMALMGNDNMHLGQAFHHWWAEFIYGKFKNANS